jgi:hypothetical protein
MKALLYYWDPEQQPLAREALRKAGRADLIGTGPKHLVPPDRSHGRSYGRSDKSHAPRPRRVH